MGGITRFLLKRGELGHRMTITAIIPLDCVLQCLSQLGWSTDSSTG